MNCDKCGQKVKEGSRFCTFCGNELVQKKKNPLVFLLAFLTLLTLVLVFVYFNVWKSKGEGQDLGEKERKQATTLVVKEEEEESNPLNIEIDEKKEEELVEASEKPEESEVVGPKKTLDLIIQQIDVLEFPVVKLFVSATDSEGDVPADLTKGDFVLQEETSQGKQTRNINKLIQLDQEEKVNLHLVADVSGSMDGTPLIRAKSIMRDFANIVQFSVGDEVELTGFNSSVFCYQQFTNEKSQIESAIDMMNSGGNTALYDALFYAVTTTASKKGSKCVIGFTDGLDNASSTTPEEVAEVATRYNIPVYIIGVGPNVSDDYLKEVCTKTGAYYRHIDEIDSLKEIYESIFKSQKELYVLEYEADANSQMHDKRMIHLNMENKAYVCETTREYTPHVLLSVDENIKSMDPIEKALVDYVKAFLRALKNHTYTELEPYVIAGSPIEMEQRKYIQNDYEEELLSYEILERIPVDDTTYRLKTKEVYTFNRPGRPVHFLTQYPHYQLIKENGVWKMYSYVEQIDAREHF